MKVAVVGSVRFTLPMSARKTMPKKPSVRTTAITWPVTAFHASSCSAGVRGTRSPLAGGRRPPPHGRRLQGQLGRHEALGELVDARFETREALGKLLVTPSAGAGVPHGRVGRVSGRHQNRHSLFQPDGITTVTTFDRSRTLVTTL